MYTTRLIKQQQHSVDIKDKKIKLRIMKKR